MAELLEAEIRALAGKVQQTLVGQPTNLVAAVLVAELGHLIAALDVPDDQVRPMTAVVVQQLQQVVAKNRVARAAGHRL